jgi:hypothetical protein
MPTISTRGVAGQDVLGAVAVVHVEVDDRHALAAVAFQRIARGERHVVEEAEAHGAAAAGVVAGRAHRAEGVLQLAGHHRVGRRHAAPAARSTAFQVWRFSAVSGSMCRWSSRPRPPARAVRPPAADGRDVHAVVRQL